MAWNTTGTKIASGSYDRTIRIWDFETGECESTSTCEESDKPISCVSFSPDGTIFAAGDGYVAGGSGYFVRLYDAYTGERLQTLDQHSPDNSEFKFVAAGPTRDTADDSPTTTNPTTTDCTTTATSNG